MKLFNFNKNKQKQNSNLDDIIAISTLFIGSKKYTLYKSKYNDCFIYFITGNDTLLYIFLLRDTVEYNSKYIFKNSVGNNISVQFLFDVDKNEMYEETPLPTLSNWNTIKKYINENKIFKSNDDDFIARIVLTGVIEGLSYLSQLSFANYKMPITQHVNRIEEDKTTEEKTEIKEEIPEKIENKNDTASESKEVENKNETTLEKEPEQKQEKIEEPIIKDNYIPIVPNIQTPKVITATANELSKSSIINVSKKLEDENKNIKPKIPNQYFVGYKMILEQDDYGNKNWTYELNKNKEPVKVYFSPQNIGKIISTHMFINGKTGSGKTSFNQSLLHTLLYHGLNIFALDIKAGSIDYSASIINKPIEKSNLLKYMNSEKYKGVLPESKNIEFIDKDIPDEALKILNPKFGSLYNRFGNKVIPIAIYNVSDEGDNASYFTALNILDNDKRQKLIEYADDEEKQDEYNNMKQEYKDGLSKLLVAYFNALSSQRPSNSDKFINTYAELITNKLMSFMEKTKFRIFPTNREFINMLKDYSMWSKDIKPDSEEEIIMNYIADAHNAKKIVDFEKGIDLVYVLNKIRENNSNFYLTIRADTFLLSFYVIYLYYLLSKTDNFKINGLDKNGAYSSIFIDEAHYLENNPLLTKVITDAQRTDRIRNRGWIFSAQRAFKSGFNMQESIGTYVFFGGQSADAVSLKARYSKVISSKAIEYINKNISTFTTDSDTFIVDENGTPLDREIEVVKSFPNRAYSDEIHQYGIGNYAKDISPYLIQNLKIDNVINFTIEEIPISFKFNGDSEKLTISSFGNDDKKLLIKMITELQNDINIFLADKNLNKEEISMNSIQYIEKIVLLAEVQRTNIPNGDIILNNYLYNYNKENNTKFLIELNSFLNDAKKSFEF